eukprot:5798272-Alexandrium_andersonii.AAC.1
MSASLVGSEMCIRDSPWSGALKSSARPQLQSATGGKPGRPTAHKSRGVAQKDPGDGSLRSWGSCGGFWGRGL